MRGPHLLAAILCAALLAGCLREDGPIDDGPRPPHVSLGQIHDEHEGIATFELRSRAPDLGLDALLVVVDGTTLERAPACPPPHGAWAWCGDAAFRAGGLLQARAEPGSTLRVVEEADRNVLLTLVVE